MNALIVVDLQNDFCPGGALPVPGGNVVVATVNRLQRQFDLVVATQDWHPANHASFAANHPGKNPGDAIELGASGRFSGRFIVFKRRLGPTCTQVSTAQPSTESFRKGVDPTIDSYSGFFDNDHRKSTGLDEYLKSKGTKDVYVCGLATDYCVKFTALDAVDLGFTTYLVEDACRGVDVNAGDVQQAIEEMRSKGVVVIQANQVANVR